jgi:integrase
MLKESPPEGPSSHQFLALRMPPLSPACCNVRLHIGWRLGEIRNLTWDKIDLKFGIIRLDPGETKNDEARTIYLFDELITETKALHSNRRLGCPFVFHREGKKIGEFRNQYSLMRWSL